MVGESVWRVLQRVGVAGGAVYLVVLFSGHVAALRSIALLLALIAALALWLRAPSRYVPLLPVFGVWAACAALSLFTTVDLHYSLDAMDGEIVRSFVVFFTFYVLTRRSEANVYRQWVLATAVGGIAVSIVAAASLYYFGAWRSTYVPLLGDFNTSAVTVLPLLVGYVALVKRRRTETTLIWAGIGATLVAAHLTFSRAFWLSVIIGVVVIALLQALRAGRLGRRGLYVAVAILVLGLLLAALAGAERGKSLTYTEDRVALYWGVAKKILTNPMTGTGYGHEADKRWYEATFPGTSFFHPHNLVLGFLDQMGPLGLLALAFIFGAPALRFARGVRARHDAAGVPTISGLAMLACVFTKNNFDYFFLNQSLWLFFAHLGIYLGELDRAVEADTAVG